VAVTMCPNCVGEMEGRSVERLYGRSVVLDICHGCQGLWFDDLELLQLAPGATLELFTTLQHGPAAARTPIAQRLQCPRCRCRLRQAHDLQRNTRFTFFRCPKGHGRYLTFFQFLRAKNFVRSLTRAEIDDLKRRVHQVNCANCGAPVNIDQWAACSFCRTPIAMIDPDQVQKVATELREAAARRQTVDPTWPVQALAERARTERTFSSLADGWPWHDTLSDRSSVDLLDAGLRTIGRWLTKHR
jgi:Zn-finger nucleic acid-binding protein